MIHPHQTTAGSGPKSQGEDKAMMMSPEEQRHQGEQTAEEAHHQAQNRALFWFFLVLVVVAIILIPYFVTTKENDNDSYDDGSRDVSYDDLYDQAMFMPDSTRVVFYGVDTMVQSRLARTVVTVDFENEIDCPNIRGFTMLLPATAKVISLTSRTGAGCFSRSDVQSIEEAYDTFVDTAEHGGGVALVDARDAENYSIQVAIPPLGSLRTELVIEELLELKRHRIEFQVPLSPGLDAEELVMDITVNEPEYGILDFGLADVHDPSIYGVQLGAHAASAHLDLRNFRRGSKPRLLRGYYTPGAVPDNGAIYAGGDCFEFRFSPSSLLADSQPGIPRTLVFILDVSGSMSGRKLKDAKAAFTTMIAALSEDDYFTVQTFSTFGTKDIWREEPLAATSYNIASAIDFVNRLQAQGSTNLNEALLQGISRVVDSSHGGEFVPVVIFLSDGRATAGETNRANIAESVLYHNSQSRVKIFSLAFGHDADFPLVSAISMQNDGLAYLVQEGFGDSTEQMESFYESELGTILLSNIEVTIDGDFPFHKETSNRFSVLPQGSEIIVRGLVGSAPGATTSSVGGIIQATTTAFSRDGPRQWSAQTTVSQDDANESRRCYQSFAHARIREIMQFRDAVQLLGGFAMRDFSPLSLPCNSIHYLDECARDEALSLAIEAQIVWPQLTALVTVEDESCAQPIDEEMLLCFDGDGLRGSQDWEDVTGDSADEGNYAPPQGSGNGSNNGNYAPPTYVPGSQQDDEGKYGPPSESAMMRVQSSGILILFSFFLALLLF